MYRILWHDASKERSESWGMHQSFTSFASIPATLFVIDMACNSLTVSRTTKCLQMDGSSLAFQPIARTAMSTCSIGLNLWGGGGPVESWAITVTSDGWDSSKAPSKACKKTQQ